MSAPSMPPDTSMQQEQMRIAEENRRQEIQDKKDADRKAELLGLRNSAGTAARGSAASYLSGQGVDPGTHGADINSTIDQILAGIPQDDPNPGSYFSDAGATIFNNLQSGQRSKADRSINQLFQPDFETRRLPYTLDDPFLSGIESEQRASADDIIRNMLDRGVITQSGFNAAEGDLDKQSAGVKSRLNEIGTGLIGTGQQDLRDVANRAHTTAANLGVDQPFDVSSYGSEADRIVSEFLSGLGTNIRSRITGNLFNTAGLGGIAGAGQGAQNTPFDPNALAGIDTSEDDKNKKKTTDDGTLF